jgi:acyl dehydratase
MNNQNQYFEDYLPGSVRTFGAILVEEKEVIEFAKRYDPQVFHTDPVEARKSIYGGLIASGWHTAAMTMRVIVEQFLSRETNLVHREWMSSDGQSLYSLETSCP